MEKAREKLLPLAQVQLLNVDPVDDAAVARALENQITEQADIDDVLEAGLSADFKIFNPIWAFPFTEEPVGVEFQSLPVHQIDDIVSHFLDGDKLEGLARDRANLNFIPAVLRSFRRTLLDVVTTLGSFNHRDDVAPVLYETRISVGLPFPNLRVWVKALKICSTMFEAVIDAPETLIACR